MSLPTLSIKNVFAYSTSTTFFKWTSTQSFQFPQKRNDGLDWTEKITDQYPSKWLLSAWSSHFLSGVTWFISEAWCISKYKVYIFKTFMSEYFICWKVVLKIIFNFHFLIIRKNSNLFGVLILILIWVSSDRLCCRIFKHIYH